MSPDRALRVADPASDLECGLTVLRASDGGAAAVVVDLRNRSDVHDVVLKVNSEMSAFIMLTATDQQGVVLSRPAKMFDSAEVQHADTVRIARSSSRSWRVPIANQVPPHQLPEQGVDGRLVVNIALIFGKVSGDRHLDDDEFESSLVTLYDMDVRLTPAALSEGAQKSAPDA